MLVALDLEASFMDAGYSVTLARSCEEATEFLDNNRPDLAVLDVRLSDGECVLAAKKLVDLGVPFIVHTGLLGNSHDPVFSLGTKVYKPAATPAIVELAGSLLGQT